MVDRFANSNSKEGKLGSRSTQRQLFFALAFLSIHS
jgi:hypothetical protein